jgi:arylsulfatase A-like enzyme
MKKYIGCCIVFLLTLVVESSVLHAQSSGEEVSKPNVLFISVDDLNTWIGVLNNYSHTKTPNIDKLAAKGVLFSNAHSQAPLCGPSRASIMTGYGHRLLVSMG